MGMVQRPCLRPGFGGGAETAIIRGFAGKPRLPDHLKLGNNRRHGFEARSSSKPSVRTSRKHFVHMTTIRVKDNEPFDVALRRFKRTIEKLGLLTDLRAREFYEKPTAERKRKKAAAVKRHYKRVRSMQLPKKMF